MVAMERYLEGRVAIITGGFSGIGKAIAIALAERGATIAPGARRQPAAVIEELKSVSDRCFFHPLDVADVDSVSEFVDALTARHGAADILVNSAGVTAHELVCGHDEQSWLDVIDINLSGPFRMIRACLPQMKARGWGRIINIGSTAATTATADHAAYCASKSGLLGLNRAVALEGAAHGVSSIVISPTWVQTEMFDSSVEIQARKAGHGVEEEIAKIVAQQPQQRLVQPRELGALAAFLCRNEALGITMEDIQLNAGALW
jgi:NAD(P)-dependent dehydrogenase (short-subunit alcohol dehydrogenase family)